MSGEKRGFKIVEHNVVKICACYRLLDIQGSGLVLSASAETNLAVHESLLEVFLDFSSQRNGINLIFAFQPCVVAVFTSPEYTHFAKSQG